MVFVRVRFPDTHKNIFYLIRPAKKIPTVCNTAARVPLLHIGAHVCAYSYPGQESEGIQGRENHNS